MTKPLILCILDGVGIAPAGKYNAVTCAKMPFFNALFAKYPHTQLNASGVAVGLPAGVMGNSEVGHITIGAGRIVNQFLRRFEVEDWDANKPLADFITDMKSRGGAVHLIGMMSDGRVHSDIEEIILIARRILDAELRVVIHFVADGRDVPPKSAQKYIDRLQSELGHWLTDGRAVFGTLSGRYYTMDRNNNMDRTKSAADAIARGMAEFSASDINTALAAAYARGETDEFIKPVALRITHHVPAFAGMTKQRVTASDGIVFCNYRSDRARQILRELVQTGARMLAFSQYGEGLDEHVPALLPDIAVKNTIGDVIAAVGKSQLRIAETEKYNHVTYFFDAERTIDFQHEEKVLIPSPAVATFDMQPAMSAPAITDALLRRLDKFDVAILNYANGDMVGHTGNEPAAIAAMEVLDAQLARLIPAALELDGTVLVTADHGNIEEMWDMETNSPKTAHTTNPVPFIVVSPQPTAISPHGRSDTAGLADIAPTMLKILGIPQPAEMTGKTLV